MYVNNERIKTFDKIFVVFYILSDNHICRNYHHFQIVFSRLLEGFNISLSRSTV